MSRKSATVIHIRNRKTGDVYIGRGSKWGNPFFIGKDGTRKEVVAKYERWLVRQPELMGALGELAGKRLVCFCKPLACHGDVLVRLTTRLINPAKGNGI